MFRNLWVLMLGAILVAPAYAGSEMEQRLEEARQRLDEAAAELAEAYSAAFSRGREMGKDRAMLGVLLDECCERDGVALSGVTPGGGADQAGIQAGDVLLSIGGVDLAGSGKDPMRKLTTFMRDVSPGDTVEVTYRRGSERLGARIETQAYSQQTMRMLREKVSSIGDGLGNMHTRVFAPDPPQVPETSLTLMDVEGDLASYFEVDEGVLVLRQPKKDSAVKAGDILLSIDGQRPVDAEHAFEHLAAATRDTTVAVQRKGRREAVTVAPGEFVGADQQAVRIIRIEVDKDD